MSDMIFNATDNTDDSIVKIDPGTISEIVTPLVP